MRQILAIPLALLVLHAPLTGQQRVMFSAFAAADDGFDAAQVGGALATEREGLGVRLSAASSVLAAGGSAVSWAADVDLTANAGALLAPLDGLRFFSGLGVQHTGAGDNRLALNLGGSYARSLAGTLTFDTELRHRTPFSQHQAPAWELRLGMSMGFALPTRPAPGLPAPRPAPLPARVRPVGGAVLAYRIIEAGEGHLGVPYKWGGNTPAEGFDCSGFLRHIFQQHGVQLPRVSQDQAHAGEPLPLRIEAFRPGDLLFFAEDGVNIDHAAMYAGDGWILHSSSSGQGVRYDHLDSPRGNYFRTRLVAARRVLGDAGWAAGASGSR